MGPDQQERAALVALTVLHGAKRLGLSTAQLRARLNRGDPPSAVLAGADEPPDADEGLFTLPSTTQDVTAEQLRSRLLADAIAHIAAWQQAGHRLVTFLDDDYPPQLASAYDDPLVLFYAGTLADDLDSFAVVGTREPSDKGLRYAAELSRAAAADGITVVSGLARGVDRAAHEAALAVGGRTVAVVGTGLDRCYPAEHQPLQRRIAAEGLVVTQFAPGAAVTRANFPIRNATMSAYSALTVIVEAGETSGTRNQAAAAVKHGRPLVLTPQIATATTWGRKYVAEGKDVTVAATPDEAMDAVRQVLARRNRVLHWAGVASDE